MEDLAYIYLALNNEIERKKEFSEDNLLHSYSAWPPLLGGELDRDRTAQSPSEQFDDIDSTFQPYQGFSYL